MPAFVDRIGVPKSAPKSVLEKVTKDQAEAAKAKLTEAGASVEVK